MTLKTKVNSVVSYIEKGKKENVLEGEEKSNRRLDILVLERESVASL